MFTAARPNPALSYFELLSLQVCESDLVVTGTVSGQRTLANRRETLLFTDNRITVDHVFRSTRSPLPAAITASVPGGAVTADGLTYTVDVGERPRLGRKYLFILSARLDARAYVPFGVMPVVEMGPQQATVLNAPVHTLTDHIRNVADLIADVANAVATCPSTQ